MGLFSKKKIEYPKMPQGDYVPVLRCSICTGEQVLCAKERSTGHLLELMLIKSPAPASRCFARRNAVPVIFLSSCS